MLPPARASAAIEALDEIAQKRQPADVVLGEFFRSRRFIGSKDRASIASAVYDLLRHYARIGWWLEKHGMVGTPRARLLAWLALTDEDPAALFTGVGYAQHPLSDDEKKLAAELKGKSFENDEMPEAVRLECPPWAEESLRNSLGENFPRELTALREAASVDLRINLAKGTREQIRKALAGEGIETEFTQHSPLGLRVHGRPQLGASPAFKAGMVEVQDEGSQCVAELVDAKPGMQVVDFCAGAGGKTLAIAAAMNNKGRVIACDVHENRLKRAALRFRRAGLHNIETRVLSTESDPWVKRHKAMFDRVLVDAPCTGTGVWRRNPDARWRPLGPGLSELAPLQGKILESAARLVKPGGLLVYATCSLLNEENSDQIAKFLESHKDFTETKSLTLTPAKDNTDGFFASVLTRKTAA